MGCAKERKVSLERCKVAYIESAEDETKMTTAPKKKAVIPNEIAVFSTLSLFQGLPTSRLRTMEQESEVQEFPAGHVFFEVGGTRQQLYLLEKGRVQTFRNLRERKLIISELVAPEIFGEMGCIGPCIYNCSAQAMEPSLVRVILRKELDALLKEFPQVTRRLLDLVGQRFVHVLLDLEAMSFQPLIPRLARLLLENAERDCVCNMTHKEIAEYLRVYRESATTALGELKRAGIVSMERRQIRILDRARLERAARE